MRILKLPLVIVTLAAITPYFAHAKKATSEEFVQMASVSNQFEIESSNLALQKSQNQAVKQFAQRMVDDHTKVADELKNTLQASNVDASFASDTLDSKHQKKMDELRSASAKRFDKKYIDEQENAHKEAVKLFEDYSKNGDDAALKDFAVRNLPTLRQHHEDVKALK